MLQSQNSASVSSKLYMHCDPQFSPTSGRDSWPREPEKRITHSHRRTRREALHTPRIDLRGRTAYVLAARYSTKGCVKETSGVGTKGRG
jgi:hypothetical protein